MALNGESQKNNFELKLKGGGGVTKKIPPNFAVTTFVIIANSPPKCQKTSISDIQKVQIFLGKHAPGPPYFIPHQKSNYYNPLPWKKAYQIERFIRKNMSITIKNEQSLIAQH